MTILDQWYLYRLEQETLKAHIADITPAALEEAQARIAGEKKKTFPIGTGKHQIQVRFTAKRIKHTDDQELDNLHAQIELEKEAAALENADAIAQIEQDLESLTKSLERLKMTDRGRALQREYQDRLDEIAEMVPVLALKGA